MTEEQIHMVVGDMMRTTHMHKKVIDTVVVNNIGIHRIRHQVLMKLARADKFKSQKEIAEHLGITQAAMTGALSKLEKDGLILRTAGKDNRFNEISITDKGREIVQLTKKHFTNVDSYAFEGISDEDIGVFVSCLSRVRANLEKFLERNENL